MEFHVTNPEVQNHHVEPLSEIQNQDAKAIVRSGYDDVAQKYLEFVLRKPTHRLEWTNKLITTIPPDSSILELGCGAGLPVTKYLLERGFTVTANDISQTQIDIAQREAPGANYIVGDMADLNFMHSTFNGVVMFFSLFHLPLEEQQDVLYKVHLWLRPRGYLVMSIGAGREPNERGDWMGRSMFWANAGTEGTMKMIEEAGLEIVESEIRLEENLKGLKNPDEGVSFLWVLARRM